MKIENTFKINDILLGNNTALSFYLSTQHQRPIVLLCDDPKQCTEVYTNLKYLTPDHTIYRLPDYETLAYDHISPHEDIISERIAALSNISQLKSGVILLTPISAMQLLAPTEYLLAKNIDIKLNDEFNISNFATKLTQSGYIRTEQVMQHGEFAIRGNVFDLFPMGNDKPLRIELFDNNIESLRFFDPDSQLSTNKISELKILPAKEFPLDELGINNFRQNWRTNFSGNPTQSNIYQAISQGMQAPGIEYYLPLFFNKLDNIFSYLPANSIILHSDNFHTILDEQYKLIQERYIQLSHDISRPICQVGQIFLNSTQFFTELGKQETVVFRNNMHKHTKNIGFNPLPICNFNTDKKSLDNLYNIINNHKTIITTDGWGRLDRIKTKLTNLGLNSHDCNDWQQCIFSEDKLITTVAPMLSGILTNEFAIITENDLYGIIPKQQSKYKTIDPNLVIKDLCELKIGDLVTHLDHGVGKYLGLKYIETSSHAAEYLELEYANNDKVFVPVNQLNKINHYTFKHNNNYILHELGNKKWDSQKSKALKKIQDVAAELLELYSKRKMQQGFAFRKPTAEFDEFRADFPFQETEDQSTAITQVILDMTSDRPMDRLICGDVGFGKTEIAMQASCLAVLGSKQVIILTPTTLLCEQHYINFKNRFAKMAIRIESISRFKTAKEAKEIIQEAKLGKIDILIGTHKVLNEDLKLPNLGLLIIDEEHAFGVKQKERIKQFRTNVDVLAMTATPLPRTLNLSLAKLRDLSLITTPPARRLAVKTFVREFNDGLIQEAVHRELQRGGQVYFLHNDVASMPAMLHKLEELLPFAKIQIANGQMPERQLEKVMNDFYQQKFNVLLCSTIIESGIDVPTANTIIINKAINFGIAQLHQLRGRVGRSHHQAYAYLLTQEGQKLKQDAKQRLEALEQLQDLGSGFLLANHDLEIRGAGELLGDEQSGHMHAIGFSLYMEMLDAAIKKLKKKARNDAEGTDFSATESTTPAQCELPISMLFTKETIPDIGIRLSLYKRLSNCDAVDKINELRHEVMDRFGKLSVETENLFHAAILALKLKSMGIKKIIVGKSYGKLYFGPKPNIDTMKLIKLIQTQSDKFQLEQQTILKFKLKDESYAALFSEINVVLELIKC
jgi:transcription-repair coupling factor (superfamily II helicase)